MFLTLKLLVNFSILLIFVFAASANASQDCHPRYYGNSSIVCVCHAEYCDTIDPIEPIEIGKYVTYTSTAEGKRFHRSIGYFDSSNTGGNGSQEFDIKIDQQTKYQHILGWGGAFTDSVGFNLRTLNRRAQAQLLKAYFSEDGIEYNMARVPMGGSDFSIRGYSYDDNNGKVDRNLSNFKLAPEDFLFKIPFIKQAIKICKDKLLIFTSTWTAPKWMKTNGQYARGFLKVDMFQVWANYFLKFLDSYKAAGITFWGITTGNEPSLTYLNYSISTVGWNTTNMTNWVANNLGPTLRNSSHKDIKIMALDDQRFLLPWFINDIFSNKATENFIDGIAVHWYWDELVPTEELVLTHEAHPDKFILATESCRGQKKGEQHVILGSWERAEDYCHGIIADLSNWVTGWIDWNIALDLQGGPNYISNFVDSPIIVNRTSGEFYKQPMFYALGHFSKFLPRESVRINSTYPDIDPDVQYVAFQRPDKGTVIIVLNKETSSRTFTITDVRRNATAQITVEKKSMTTILYW